jgi:hypothetical protein
LRGYLETGTGGSSFSKKFYNLTFRYFYLYGLVARVPGYRSRGPGFDSRGYQSFLEVVGLERGPLSLVRIIEELLEKKGVVPV